MKRILLLFLIIFCNSVFGQLIVNNTTQTPAQLVQNVLLGGGITISNVTFNGTAANAAMVRDQVGFFTNGSTTNLGINEGVILSTGRAIEAIGPNNSGSTTLASAFPMNGDPDLAAIASGAINTKAILEFDFVPIGNSLSFNFVFGSEEYLEYVGSSFNDVFGFFLSGPGITGPYTGGAANIALVPSTTTPISINNVNATSNPTYYVNNGTGATPLLNPTIQFDGFTTVIAAQATVQCGMTYHIKLAISNVGDSSFDSAVFLQAQSFNTNAFSFPNDFLISNGFAPCYGDSATICTGLPATIPHSWTFNGVPIPGETGPCITVTEPGEYCATAYPFGLGCPISDCITVEFLPPLPLNNPEDRPFCGVPVNLTYNTPIVLGSLSPSLYEVNYFTNLSNAQNLITDIPNPTIFTPTSNPQTIYIRIDDSSGSNCFEIKQFQITIDPTICSTYADQPPNLEQCDDASNDGIGVFDFTPQTAIALGIQVPGNYTVTYHTSLLAAQAGTGAISPITNYQNTSNPQTIYVRVESISDPTFFGTNSFQLIVDALPTEPTPADVTVCDSYVLPALPTGQTYHSATGGTAVTQIAAGTSITTTQTIFVFAQSGTIPNCTSEGDFVVTVNNTPIAPNPADVTVCDSYVLPALPAGQTYHSATGGNPATQIAAGTSITTTQTIFVFAQTGTTPNCTSEGDFVVTVNVTPTAPNPADVTVCDSYVLPALPAGQTYHSATGGTVATQIAAGTSITTTQTIFVFAQTGTTPNCTSEGDFVVTVNSTPTAPTPADVTVCDSYVLPALPAGQTYHSATGGNPATQIAAGTSITTTQTIFVFAQTGTTPNCTSEGSFVVTVNTTPTAPTPANVTVCDSYVLPALPAGQTYHTATGGAGTTLAAGGSITTTQTIFVFAQTATTPNCTSEGSFVVTVNNTPVPANPADVTSCVSYTLPSILVGNYYTASNGGGTPLFAGDAITTNQTIYIYAQTGTTPNCFAENSFDVTITIPPTINTPTNYVVCDQTDNNGIQTFNLPIKDAEFTTDPTLVVQYYETLTNSQTGANPLVSPYQNISPSSQTIYVAVFNPASPACRTLSQFNLIVNPVPLPLANVTNYELCDVTAPGDGLEVFTLNTKDVEIANGLTNVTIKYYDNLADATAQTVGAQLPNSYQNTVANQQTIWFNISNNTTGCNTTGSFKLIVNPLPTVVAPNPMYACSNGTVMTAEFNLTLNNGSISGGVPGVTVTYYLTLADAQNEINPLVIPYTNLTNPQTVYVRVENNATGCSDTTSLQLNVTQGPVAVTPTALEYCDPNNDGYGTFDLASAINEIAGGSLPAGVSVTFHETATDALIGATPLTSPYTNINPWTQTIYVRVFYTLTGCANYVQLQLIVNPTPEATTPVDYHQCDNDFDGFTLFDLTTINAEVLGSINPATHTVSYYTTLPAAQAGTGAITNVTNYLSNNTTLYVRVETIATGCYDIVELKLVVDPLPNSTQPAYAPYSLCETPAFGVGFESFDLASKIPSILLGQTGIGVTFYPSLTDAQDGTNMIVNLNYVNVPIYVQTLGIRLTNDQSGCYVVSTMDIRVEPLPTPVTPLIAPTVCDGDQDGFSDFDLNLYTAEILQGANYIITYHETQIDAQLNQQALSSPYTTINPLIQIIWVRAQDPLTGCFSVMPLTLNVNPSPIMPLLSDLTLCDQDSNPFNGSTLFNLTLQTPLILAAQTVLPTSNYSVTYYTSLANAQTQTGNIVNTTSYPNLTNGQTIWVVVKHTITGCFNIGSFQLMVNAPLALTTPTPLSLCDSDANPNNQFTVFDLTVKNDQITGIAGSVGYTVTYYPSWPITATSVAIPNPTSYTNIAPAVQTLGVMVTTAQGCTSVTTLDIRVLPIPVPNTNPAPLAPQCDYNNPGDMLEVFDLTTNAAYIINGDPSLTLHYFASQGDAINNVNEITNPATASVGTNVWIRVENNRVDYQGNNCYVLVEQALTVNPLPLLATIPAYQICEEDAVINDGFEIFDLTSQGAALLANNPVTTPVSTYTLAYYTDSALTNQIVNPASYTNITNPQTIYVVATNDATGCRSAVGAFTILVNPKPAITLPTTLLNTCDSDGTNDGYFLFPLDGVVATEILNGQDPTQFGVTFYNSEYNPDATPALLPAPISDLANYMGYTHTIWAAVTNLTTGCYKIEKFDAVVEQLPEPEIVTLNDINTICVDYTDNVVVRTLTLEAQNNTVYLDPTTIPTPAFEYHWYEDGTEVGVTITPFFTIDQPLNDATQSLFTVEMINQTSLGCSQTSPGFTVIQSGQAEVLNGTTGYTVTNAFEQNQVITVSTQGHGTYVYSLDDGPQQASPVFENVSLGEHTITVWDTEGGLDYSCDPLIIEGVQTINYPHYFTPNGDGIHDTWNIVGLSGQPNAKIYIFDRFGKLIKQISPTSPGWDGTLNGEPLPSTDYWFRVDYLELANTKQFKAHFSLKR